VKNLKVFADGDFLSIASATMLAVLLFPAVNAQVPESPKSEVRQAEEIKSCPNDPNVQLTCLSKGTLVKKFVCTTQHGRGVSVNLAQAIRIACSPPRANE
jgi:hypothetical protein